jgi:hypothetical protein
MEHDEILALDRAHEPLILSQESDSIIWWVNSKLILPQTFEQVKGIGGRRCHS